MYSVSSRSVRLSEPVGPRARRDRPVCTPPPAAACWNGVVGFSSVNHLLRPVPTPNTEQGFPPCQELLARLPGQRDYLLVCLPFTRARENLPPAAGLQLGGGGAHLQRFLSPRPHSEAWTGSSISSILIQLIIQYTFY